MMGHRVLVCVGALFLILFTIFPSSRALISSPEANPPYPKAISDLKEAIVKGLGFQSEEVKVSGFDVRDALVGHSVSYEFDLEIDNKVLPFKLLEDVNRWGYVDLPIFQVEQPNRNGLVPMRNKKTSSDDVLPVLAPFQLAGPMELWIQDANNMRLSLPYDVDAGVLKKVILSDGSVVTVKGARSVSLRHPIDLPLPLNQSSNEFASGLLSLAEQLRRSSTDQESPLLSLRIVGPTSLASTSQSPDNKLKLKRLAPGLVELSSMSKDKRSLSTIGTSAMTTVLTPREFTTMWPITSINGSNANLIGFEKLLTSVLGPKAQEKGSFKVLKANVAAQTFMKIGFGVEKKLKEADLEGLSFPEWRTKPETMRMHFEVLAKVDGEKVIPENVMRVDPIPLEDTIAQNVITGNVTMSKLPIIQSPPSPFTL
ncbi:predicted protein [Arabidopsis lyrata subsp. lyrata]|uniref:Predicted protein n=1 Tax=Arabidopsis lyrata subsp. lyrata TaxID=81972 RepID=D7MRU8_ARALL|nr:uncharacterized protein LOC9302691 [Arabidopsis lyrata subsp. lyrata]EFH41165.1 predicted protein [Arabidopsis lyrata subsp. lyrata]|eukprot:XP_002864906.1 uncharacterized protein LOC9302691 [Arabidopsis lyrata subsp. lyrata]